MLQRIEYPELFFGLVAPIGVDLSETFKHLEAALKVFGYATFPVKVTESFSRNRFLRCGTQGQAERGSVSDIY
jgi:hypothetical protein